MTNAKREQKPRQRDLTFFVNGIEQFLRAGFAPALAVFSTARGWPGPKRSASVKISARGAQSSRRAKKGFDLFRAQAFDVERGAADKMLQPFHGLRGADKARQCSGAPNRPARGWQGCGIRGRFRGKR